MSIAVDDIPVAHTPPGGWVDEMPPPVLAGCTEPIPRDAPDLAGMWRITEVDVAGELQPEHPVMGQVHRIEQAGDRIVITGGGIVHDMRCDGTVEHGVHDVAAIDKTTEITVVATYESGVHVLRPVGIPVEITRRREGDHIVWVYAGFTARMERIGDPS